jgi:hypothetical protein
MYLVQVLYLSGTRIDTFRPAASCPTNSLGAMKAFHSGLRAGPTLEIEYQTAHVTPEILTGT